MDFARNFRIACLVVSSMLAMVSLSGCASLPPAQQNPASSAFANPVQTKLGRLVQKTAPKAGQSGVRLLVSGEDALGSLVALARHAERSLDLQYYIVRNDASTRTLLREIHRAAVRGVRVRVLVDDLNTSASDESLLCFTRHQNIELRLYNPFPAGRFSTITRILSSLTDIERINQRMHGKMFVADNAIAATGGRNLGDEYFVRSPTSNFVDLDAIVAGPAVRRLSATFDRFWNDPLAYPIAQLVTAQPDCAGPVSATQQLTRNAAGEFIDAPDSTDVGSSAFANDLAASRLRLSWVDVTVLADLPAKIEVDRAAPQLAPAATPAEQPTEPPAATTTAAPNATPNATPTATTAALTAAARAAAKAASIADDIARLMDSARDELILITPYFVPGPRGMTLMRTLRTRGVRVRVLTNSLASTDAPVVHIGYARYRPELLSIGVELYELRNQLDAPRSRLGSFGSSLASLHAKAVIVDRATVLVGSMNMDPRSERLNTEMGLVIPDAGIAGQLVQLFEDVSENSSYRVERTAGGSLRWTSASAAVPDVEGREPDAGVGLRTLMWLLTPFAPEELL